MSFSWKLSIQLLGALVTIGVIHGFMLWLDVPSPQALILGSVIYAALVAVLFSRWLFIDKIKIYLVFIVMLVVGGNTLCPCTGAELIAASIAGIVTFVAMGLLKSVLSHDRSEPDQVSETDNTTETIHPGQSPSTQSWHHFDHFI